MVRVENKGPKQMRMKMMLVSIELNVDEPKALV